MRAKACRQSAALSVAKRQKVQVAKEPGTPDYDCLGNRQLEPEMSEGEDEGEPKGEEESEREEEPEGEEEPEREEIEISDAEG